jgi:uncharacterized protein YcbK (DUF882 family)
VTSAHFPNAELACKCCKVNLCTDVLVNALEAIREAVGKPVNITSGYRCPEHNAKVGGEPNSFHVRGMAADIRVAGMTPAELYRLISRAVPRIGGFGVADDSLHVDVRTASAKWTYGPDGKQRPWNPQIEVIA